MLNEALCFVSSFVVADRLVLRNRQLLVAVKTLVVIVENREKNIPNRLNNMTRVDPIIAVKDIEASAKWYQQVFGFRNDHGGKDFAVLKSEDDKIILCLHKWGEHSHPPLTDQSIKAGNGLLLYFRTDNMENIRKNIDEVGTKIEEEIHQNLNSLRREFSFRDIDGYYLTISEFHKYEG